MQYKAIRIITKYITQHTCKKGPAPASAKLSKLLISSNISSAASA